MFFYRGKSRLNHHLEPQTTIYKWMFGETTIFYVMIWNHPIETSIYKWSFGVPGSWENNFFPFFQASEESKIRVRKKDPSFQESAASMNFQVVVSTIFYVHPYLGK